MKTFRFYWLDGKSEESIGTDPADAFCKLGYSAGAISALDYYEEIQN
jgi:hypothetical protein